MTARRNIQCDPLAKSSLSLSESFQGHVLSLLMLIASNAVRSECVDQIIPCGAASYFALQVTSIAVVLLPAT